MLGQIKKLGVPFLTDEERRKRNLERFMQSDAFLDKQVIDDALAKTSQTKPIEAVNPESLHVYIITTPDGKTHWARNLLSGTGKDTYLTGEDGTVYVIPRAK